jgi:mitochondrial import inner membrane translocase subunit TIM10
VFRGEEIIPGTPLAATPKFRADLSSWIFEQDIINIKLLNFISQYDTPTIPNESYREYRKYVNVWRIRPASAFIGREDRSRRSRDGSCDRYVQQVRPLPPSSKLYFRHLLTVCIGRLQQACMKKCIPREYREGELNKGEGVCIDRCAAKFFDVQMKVSELLQQEAQAKGAGGGMGFGGM